MKTNTVLFDIYESLEFATRVYEDLPAPMLSMATVLGRSADGGRGVFFG